MKMKSMVMWSTVAFLSASFACITPAMADEFGSSEMSDPSGAPDPMMLSDNSSANPAMQAPADSGMPNPDNSMSSGMAQNGGDNMNPQTTQNNDQGGPDTATGDDDY